MEVPLCHPCTSVEANTTENYGNLSIDWKLEYRFTHRKRACTDQGNQTTVPECCWRLFDLRRGFITLWVVDGGNVRVSHCIRVLSQLIKVCPGWGKDIYKPSVLMNGSNVCILNLKLIDRSPCLIQVYPTELKCTVPETRGKKWCLWWVMANKSTIVMLEVNATSSTTLGYGKADPSPELLSWGGENHKDDHYRPVVTKRELWNASKLPVFTLVFVPLLT